MIHGLLPVFLVSTLGVSTLTLGFIEGIAEAVALIVKVFSGAISDFFGRRKALLLLGYGLAALTKPLFPLAHSAETVFAARLLDRIGKGIRGAPRDALVADVAPAEIRGACFGLRQSMDTVGAFLGPLLAILLMYLFRNEIPRVLWFAIVPAFVAVLVIFFGVEETSGERKQRAFTSPLRREAMKSFPAAYWWVVTVGGIFTLARFSEAFLVLRAQQVGLAMAWAPLVLLVMSVVYALAAYPAGVLADRMNRQFLLTTGLLVLVGADIVLAQSASVAGVLCGVALWGLHMGLTQGILAAMIADTAPVELKGTAFGLFNLVSGVCLLLASIIAGWLWDRHGASLTFQAGAAFAVVAVVVLLARPPRMSALG